MYITGGTGVQRHGEGFAKAYFLPNKDAYAETCASIGLALWSHRLTMLHKDAEYYDIFERVLFNGLLSGVSLDGKEFFYENPLEADGEFAFNEGQIKRSAWFDCSCCPTNVVRFLPSIGGYVYTYDSNGIYVNLYVNNNANIDWQGQNIKIKQKTRYPWDGHVKIEFDPDSEGQFNLALRIPGWVRGKAVPGDLYQFKDTDLASQEKIRVAVNSSAAAVESNKGRIALQRGPVMYCLEEEDNGSDILNIAISEDADFTDDYQQDLLGGVVTIQSEIALVNISGHESKKKKITAIPYYSWANRKPGQMLVWIPEN